ncbi:MAG: hypothetical protein EOP70_04125 [Variovorax sp.]|nr:MAG: hypothetical protein EOP70_04125 [Variovorax sp.]
MASKPTRAPRMYERGILCALIGIAIIVGPRFLQSSRFYEMVSGAYVVGWFALVLGIALTVVDLIQRAKRKRGG